MLISALAPAAAQTPAAREAAEARRRYQQANAAPTKTELQRAMGQEASSFLAGGAFEPGVLRTCDGQRRPVSGLRYHAGQQLVEVEDSLSAGDAHLWPVGSLRGFDLRPESGALRRFRPRLVHEGAVEGARREFVEVLTTLDSGPLLLGWLFVPAPADAEGPACLMQLLVAGAGPASSAEGLRPLELSQPAVLHLFGARAEEVRSFAAGQRLRYHRPADVARMVDYFNRVALVKL
ncbi:hypothetical protein [uncultured Hymenobacter sp.]|uniref:hypothetical protein n=1 Tax=uncultured Hymenobacter sp. TaxID=170016 RepID=UPI0035CA6844